MQVRLTMKTLLLCDVVRAMFFNNEQVFFLNNMSDESDPQTEICFNYKVDTTSLNTGEIMLYYIDARQI